MKKRNLAVFLGCLGVLCLSACHGPREGGDVLERRPDDPLLAPTLRARVLVFVSNDCPIANRYAPELRRLHERYAPQGVAFWLVHSDPDETLASIREHDRQYHLDLPVARDPDQALARRAKAEVVPTAAVFSLAGELLYHGRIDDRFVELGRERAQPSRHDLQEVLDALLAGRPVPFKETRAVGCYIPNAR